MSELTEALFHRHVQRGEVVVSSGAPAEEGWAVGVLVAEQLPSEDSWLRLALLCGEGPAAARLVDDLRQVVDEPIRFRVPRDAPMIAGHEELFRAAGFVTPDWELHILARPMDEDHPIPPADPRRVVLADQPRANLTTPHWRGPGAQATD